MQLRHRLRAADSSTPVVARGLVLLGVVRLDGRDELGELSLVLSLDLSEGKDRRGLASDDGAEAGLALNDNVGDAHLAAERGEEDDELDGVDVVGDDDEVGLLVLDEADDVVQSRLDEEGLLGLVRLLSTGEVSGLLLEADLLLLLGLALVLVQEAEQLGSGVLVEDVLELGQGRGDLEALVEDNLLALEADVFGPLDEPGQVSGHLDRLSDAEVLGALLEEGVLLGDGGLGARGGGDLLSGLGGGLRNRKLSGLE